MKILLKRGGVWGVRCLLRCAIGQPLAKTALIFCAFLPLVSFGYTVDEIKARVRGAYLYSWDSSYNQTSRNYNGHYDSVVSAFRSNWLAVDCSVASLYVPDIDDIAYDRTNSYSSANSARPVYDLSDKYYPLTTFEDLRIIFKFAQSLYSSGYRGTGFSNFNEVSTTRAKFNFNYIVACSDILSSTNTVFRQILLNHLSSIDSNVQTIAIDVSSLSSSVSALSDSVASNSISIAGVSSNLVSLVDPIVGVYSNTSFSASLLAQVSSNSALSASSLAQVSSNSSATVSSLAQVSSNSAATVSALSDISANTSSSAASLSSIDSSSSSAAQSLSGIDYNVGRVHDSFGAFRSDFDKTSAYLAASVSGGAVPSPDNPFFPYNPNDPSDPNHPSNPSSPWNPNSSNFVGGGGGQGAFTTNHVLRPITNVVRQASADVQSNATQNAENIRSDNTDHHNELMNLLQGDGVNARIVFPWYGVDQQAVNVDSESFHVWGASLDKIESSLGNIYSSSQTDWERWFERWDSQFPDLTNLVFEILCSISNSSDRSYMLLDDYASYISNGVYSSSLDVFAENCPSVYSNLLSYGLSPAEENGRFWSLFGATLLHHNEFVGHLLHDIKEVREFADSKLDDGILGTASRSADSIPSVSSVQDKFDQLSNSVASISFDRLSSLVTSCSNRFASAISPFDHGTGLPSEVRFLFLKSSYSDPGHVFTIPVGEHEDLWTLIRLSMGVALCIVNLILLPKFVLRVVRLYVRLFWGAISLPK